jgi:hypothetical protein
MIDSACLERLRELDLSLSLTDEDLALIIAHADRFAHLEVLDLTGNAFSRATARVAIQRLPRLRVNEWLLR